MQAIGIFGGTFDPIHFGHLRMAEELRMQLGLAQVRFVPSARPPHRDCPHTSAEARAAMVRLAIAGNPTFVLDEQELHRAGPSYTSDTLTNLRREHGADISLVLLIGSDAFLGLPTWHRWQELSELAHIVVAYRPGAELHEDTLPIPLREFWRRHQTNNAQDVQRTAAGKILWQPITALDIAASKLRAMLAQGASTRYLIPETIRDYIDSHHLYALEGIKENHGT